MAGLLGLNRTTVSAAYEILESEGLISGQVGRGSFVTGGAEPAGGVDWNRLLERNETPLPVPTAAGARTSSASPSPGPRATCSRSTNSAIPAPRCSPGRISPTSCSSARPLGYEPLRRYLMEEARRQHVAGPGDDLLITNGCQQALDLIGRVLLRPGDTVAVEDPLYTGLKNLLTGMGAQLCGIPVGADGMDPAQVERVLERERPRFLVVTSNFQNPTGVTLAAGRPARAARRRAQVRRPRHRERRLWRTAL